MTAGIVGRDEELRVLADALDVARPPTAIVLAGEAGIGKTTLWRAGVELARERSYRVLVSRPAQAEAGMPFAGLGDLLAEGFDDVAGELPTPQRRALQAALLLAEPGGTAPRANEIAQATLTSLRELASAGPVLIAVDDVQWLDAPSAEALRFALRRIRSEPIAVLLGWRVEGEDVPLPLGLDDSLELALSRMRVGSLSLGALQRLVAERLGKPLSRPALLRVQETSGGNPFFALELARSLVEHGVPVSSHEPLPVPSTLAALLEERFAGLPSSTLAALELAALTPEPTVARIAAASRRSAARALAPAVEAGVVDVQDEVVAFSHPLIAAALVARMTEVERQKAHRRLAATSPTLEEQAIHLARGARRAEETVASAIEEAATRIAARGAPRDAAELLDEAVRLTPVRESPGLRRRLLLSGRHWYRAFDWGRARERAQAVLDGTSDPRERAEALLLLAMCGSDASAEQLLRETSDDHALRARAWSILANRQIGADLERALDSARNAVAAAERAEDQALLAEVLALLGFTESVRGEPSALEHLARGVEIEKRVEGIDPAYSPTLALAECAFARDELEESREHFEVVLQRAVDSGDDAARAHVLWVLAYAEYKAGRWAEADALLIESHALHRESGHVGEEVAALYLQAIIEACRGDAPRFEACCAEARRLAGQADLLEAAARQEEIALQLLDLGYERYEQAASYGDSTVAGPHGWIEPGMRPTVANRIEALVGAGRLDEAEAMLVEWEELGRRLDRPRALATGARCRGLLLAARGEHEAALASLEQALVEHERLPVPFERARTLLALGTQRRRLKKRAEAREALEQALAIFEELGARPWAERARRELGRIPGRRASDRDELTASERRIAELVAEGRSNKEVAAALFLSVKTVEVSLTRIYRKLGVRSRSELARRFPKLTAAS